MCSKLRLLAILTVFSLIVPLARAQAQQESDEDEGTFPKRLEQFGRSLVGGYRGNGRPPNQRPSRNNAEPQQSQPQQQRSNDPYYDTAFGDDDVAPRKAPPASGQQAMRRGQQNAAPQNAQRKVNDSAVENAPPLAASTGRSAAAHQRQY